MAACAQSQRTASANEDALTGTDHTAPTNSWHHYFFAVLNNWTLILHQLPLHVAMLHDGEFLVPTSIANLSLQYIYLSPWTTTTESDCLEEGDVHAINHTDASLHA